jgi:hypothetical protein
MEITAGGFRYLHNSSNSNINVAVFLILSSWKTVKIEIASIYLIDRLN